MMDAVLSESISLTVLVAVTFTSARPVIETLYAPLDTRALDPQ